MAFTGKPSILKRQKEQARRDKKQQKAQRKAERQHERGRTGGSEGEDPDIAGIVPGPQPKPPGFEDDAPGDRGPNDR